jgi:hypothetical protein
MKSVNCTKPGYTSITCSKISNIPYNLIFTTQFNDSSILITIISCEYLNLSLNMLATSKYQPRLSSITKIFSKWISQSDCSIQIKLNYIYMNKKSILALGSHDGCFFFIIHTTFFKSSPNLMTNHNEMRYTFLRIINGLFLKSLDWDTGQVVSVEKIHSQTHSSAIQNLLGCIESILDVIRGIFKKHCPYNLQNCSWNGAVSIIQKIINLCHVAAILDASLKQNVYFILIITIKYE